MIVEIVLYLLLSLMVVMLPILHELMKRNPILVEPVILFNFGFFASYFLKAILIATNPEIYVTYQDRWVNPPTLLWYFLVSLVGLISFNFGYFYSARGSVIVCSQRDSVTSFHRMLPLLAIILSFASSISIISNISFDFASLLYSLEAWETFRNLVMRVWLEGGALFLLPVYIGFFHIAYEVYATQSVSRLERLCVLLMAIFIIFVLGSRAILLTWALSFVIYFALWKRKMSLRKQFTFLALLAPVGAILGIAQKITTEGAASQELGFPFNLFHRLSSSYEQFENLVNMINAKFNFDFGKSIFEDVFVTYLPRLLFDSKPVDYGFMRVQTVLFADFWEVDRGTTYPVGMLAELYFNFWYIGIVLGMFLLGVIVAKLRRLALYDAKYVPVFCAIGALFIAPLRTYGTLLLMIFLYLAFVVFNDLFVRAFGRRASIGY